MDYGQFRAEYDPVFDILDAEKLPPWLPGAVTRLKELAATIDDPAARRSAENDIASLEDVLAEGSDGPPISPAMMEAIRIHSEAGANHGTPAERIARAEAGMAAIGRIAEAAPPTEQASILDLNESLYMLILALEPDRR
jgi:hypothetical protein